MRFEWHTTCHSESDDLAWDPQTSSGPRGTVKLWWFCEILQKSRSSSTFVTLVHRFRKVVETFRRSILSRSMSSLDSRSSFFFKQKISLAYFWKFELNDKISKVENFKSLCFKIIFLTFQKSFQKYCAQPFFSNLSSDFSYIATIFRLIYQWIWLFAVQTIEILS